MNKLALLNTTALLLATSVLYAQNVGIGTTTPDQSARLEISSDSSGILIPRMTYVQRDVISNPATGLLVFVTTDSAFYFFDGAVWVTLDDRARWITDADRDTRIQAEAGPDDDILRFSTGGTEYFRMDSGRFEVLNTGHSVFVGNGAGANDDLTDNLNTALGDSALYSNTTGQQNTATGYRALLRNTTGYRNTATGESAMLNTTTGPNNTANGFGALEFNTTGNNNTATGAYAMQNSTASWHNTATGANAMQNNTTGSYNTATGYEALYHTTTGQQNVATGWRALRSNTTGSYNTATGIESLRKNISGSYNTANGYLALYDNTTGWHNTAIGNRALQFNTTGEWNTATGGYALYQNTTGNRNTATGNNTLYQNTTGNRNTAMGNSSLFLNSSGNSNTAMGDSSLNNNSSGNSNTAIGYNANTVTSALTNATAIGANALVNCDSCLVLGDAVNVGIGVSSPESALHIDGDIKIGDAAQRDFRIQKIVAADWPDLVTYGGIGIGSHSMINRQMVLFTDGNANDPIFTVASSGDAGANWNARLVVKQQGNVGIGESAPHEMLEIAGYGRMFIGDGGGDNRTGLLIDADEPGDYVRIHPYNYELSSTMDLYFPSRIAIGFGTAGTPTKGQVEIAGDYGDFHGSYGFLKANGNTGTSVDSVQYSLYASGRIAASEFNAHSDARIKRIKGVSVGAEDLETLMQIGISDYTMRDTLTHGNRSHKKVIAQQVAEVYPQAVTKTITEVIPDIYRRATLVDGWIILDSDLKAGERVKVITDCNTGVYDILEAETKRFRVKLETGECETENTHVFVYGREVDDFHTVDYEAISMLNVSATQELARQTELLTSQVDRLLEMIGQLQTDNQALATEMQSLKQTSEGLD